MSRGLEKTMSAEIIGKTLALSCAFLWAIAVILYKRSGETIPPTPLNLYKTLVSTGLFLPVMIFFPIAADQSMLTTEHAWILFISGTLGVAVADSLFFKSLNFLGAGLSAIVDCLYSPMVILISFMMLTTPLTAHHLVGGGMVVAAVLVATLRVEPGGHQPGRLVAGFLLGAAAMVAMAFSIVLMKPVLDEVSVILVTGLRLIAATAVLMIYVGLRGKARVYWAWVVDRRMWKHAFPAAVIGNFLAMTLWIAGFKFTDVSSAAILNQTSTIFIVIFASLMLKEPFTLRRFLATLLAFGGSVLVIFD